MKNKIYIAGGTGFIGTELSKELRKSEYEIILISRRNIAQNELSYASSSIRWDEIKSDHFENIKAVINLAGAPISKRWTDAYKEKIIKSRTETTDKLVDLIRNTKTPPQVYINASAVGYYGDRGNESLTENSLPGKGFLADVCKKWEAAANNVSDKTRTVINRIGVVLDKDEGALAKMLPAFKFFIGGPLGAGNQYFPWIHIKDLAGLFVFAIENDRIRGAMNCSSPNPVTMNEFARTLGEVLNKPSFFRVPEFVLNLVLGESKEMITNSQKVIPEKAQRTGYDFSYTSLKESLININK